MTFLIFLILGGLYGGFFTPNEAAGVGVSGVLLIGLVKRQFTWQSISSALFSTVRTTGLVFSLIIGAQIFGRFVTLTDIPMALAAYVTSLNIPVLAIVIAIVLMYFVLGCFLDSMAMTLLTLPIIAPILTALGVDLIWFGVIFVIVVELSFITPPVGMNVWALAGVLNIPMQTVFRGIFPFIIPLFLLIGLLMVFPEIALYLPSVSK